MVSLKPAIIVQAHTAQGAGSYLTVGPDLTVTEAVAKLQGPDRTHITVSLRSRLLATYSGQDDPMGRECEGCLADAGEACFPGCLSEVA